MLFIKQLGVGLFFVTSGVAGAATIMSITNISFVEISKDDAKNISIYASGEAIKNYINSERNKGDNKFKCEFDGNYFECEIFKLSGFEKNQTNLNKLKTDNTNTSVTTNDLRSDDKIYKIKINKEIGSWNKPKTKINVLPIDATHWSASKQYARLTPLFSLSNTHEIDEQTKTDYFVFKSANPASVGDAAKQQPPKIPEYKCVVSADSIADTVSAKDVCVVSAFSSNTEANKKWQEIDFQAPQETSVDIESGKYYLVKLKNKSLLSQAKHLKIQKTNATTISVTGNLLPAFYVGKHSKKVVVLAEPETSTAQL